MLFKGNWNFFNHGLLISSLFRNGIDGLVNINGSVSTFLYPTALYIVYCMSARISCWVVDYTGSLPVLLYPTSWYIVYYVSTYRVVDYTGSVPVLLYATSWYIVFWLVFLVIHILVLLCFLLSISQYSNILCNIYLLIVVMCCRFYWFCV